jgi:UDP-N-acetylglucosamine 2-epimerase
VRIGHVEAGLRTENRQQPFPEEINRRIVDLVADAYFAPTWESAENLRRERISDSAIHVTGNTVVDALKWMSQQPYDWNNGPLAAVDRDAPVVLITVHRRESFGAPMNNIVSAIRTLVEEFGGTHQFIWPVHLNPHVRTVVESQLGQVPGLVLLPPLDYASMVQVMKAASLVLTDSGGVQEEAPTFGAPVLVLRETTERPEGVSAGVATLVGTDPGRILTAARMMLRQSPRLTNSERANPYGDGKAAERIADVLIGR